MSEQPPKRLVIHSNAARDKTRPPQTQLVGWKQYLEVVSTKGVFYSFAACCGCAGALLILLSLVAFGLAGFAWQEGENALGVVILGAFLAALGIAAIWSGKAVFSTAQEMDHVALITPRNARLLPVRTTLVRAADPPAPDPQAELLRAAHQGSETPNEQLLRATPENRQDV